MSNDVVIIGAGHAGGMTAISLRQKNYDGLITLIGKEAYLPYQRPPLSKGFLAGEMDKERLYLKTQSYFEKHNIHVIKERKVLEIDRDKKNILLNDQKQIEYGKLVVATGSKGYKSHKKRTNHSDRMGNCNFWWNDSFGSVCKSHVFNSS